MKPWDTIGLRDVGPELLALAFGDSGLELTLWEVGATNEFGEAMPKGLH